MKKITLFLFLLLSANSFASIGNPELLINIQNNGSGINVTSITNNGLELLNTSTNSDVFSLYMTDTATNQDFNINSRTGWSSVNVNELAQSYTITLSSPSNANLPSSLQVLITVNANGTKSDWDISVSGLGGFTLNDVDVPELNLKANANDSMFVPRFSGKIHENPVTNNLNWNRKYPAGWHANMQYLSYYNSQYGIYLGFHDPKANDKFFHTQAQSGGMLIEAKFPIPNATIAGNNWEMPGVFELDVFNGDWYDAAKIYQAWVSTEAEYWPNDTPARQERLQELGSVSVWTTFSEAQPLVHLIEPYVTSFADYMGVPTGLTWYRWNGLEEDENYPEYFPPTANMDTTIANMQSHTPKIRVAPYVNGRLFDVSLDGTDGENTFDYNQDGEDMAVSNSDGSIPTADFNGSTFATMCPSQPYWRSIIKTTVTRITETIGSAGMYLDQIGAARSYPCMDPLHGHTLKGGSFWREGYRDMLNGVYDGISSNKFLTTESGSDYLTDVMDGFMVQGWQANNQVPAFHVVYSSKVMFYGMQTGVSQYRDSKPQFYMKLSQAYSYGVQLGRFFTSIINETGEIEKAPLFIKKLATMRHKLVDFFSFGKMQRRSEIAGLPTITDLWEHTFDGAVTVTIDAIQTSTWLSEKFGVQRYMFNFTNAYITDDNVNFNFEFNAADYGLTGQLYIQEITQDSNGVVETSPHTFSKAINLQPRDSVAFIISSSPLALEEFRDLIFMHGFE